MKEAIRKSGVLVEALPYIKKFFGKTVVIKYGGAAVDEKGIDRGILDDIMFMNFAGMHPVVIHGGGPFISKLMKKAGIEPRFINGRRYTDDNTIKIIDKALHMINRKIVAELRKMGGRAFGLSGRENGLIKAKKLISSNDLGNVGEVTSVDVTVVKNLLNDNMIPVIYPLGQGRNGELYNVNADDVASAIAAKLKAEKFVLLTNVMGIMKDKNDPMTLFNTLKSSDVKQLIDDRIIDFGMIPKAEACVSALRGGVKKAHILDAGIKHAMLLEIFTNTGIGTEIVK